MTAPDTRRDVVEGPPPSAQVTWLCDTLAELFVYPDEQGRAVFLDRVAALQGRAPKVAEVLKDLHQHYRDTPDTRLEEEYTAAFDTNGKTAMEIGWHLYGETYQRGEFLGQMREMMRRLGVPETRELPDHLENVLRCVGRAPVKEGLRLRDHALVPALTAIREALLPSELPWKSLPEAVDLGLKQIELEQITLEQTDPKGLDGEGATS